MQIRHADLLVQTKGCLKPSLSKKNKYGNEMFKIMNWSWKFKYPGNWIHIMVIWNEMNEGCKHVKCANFSFVSQIPIIMLNHKGCNVLISKSLNYYKAKEKNYHKHRVGLVFVV